jgi:hypothetical protein
VTRHEVPISEAGLKNPRHFTDAGIKAGWRYHLWEAAIAAGATLEELQKLEDGQTFSQRFKANLIGWHRNHMEVEKHATDASIKKPKKGR